ncbi:hypothetical protein ACP8HI_04410 [Paenibacillus sp. FA6]|uniref:hypothetical protein n=1 Tax=Paenibacillus sp. FA6 TaxID=3413029 RepID=UPI003F65EFE8
MKNDELEKLLADYEYRNVTGSDNYNLYAIDFDYSSIYLYFEENVNCLRILSPRITEIYRALLPSALEEINLINSDIFFGALFISKDDDDDEFHLSYIYAVALERGEGTALSQRELKEYIDYISYLIPLTIKKLEDLEREYTNGLNV